MASKRLSLLIAGALAAAPLARAEDAAAPLTRTFTLEEAEHLAVNNNAPLLSAAEDITIAQQRVQEAKFLFLPEIGLQASATRYNARYPFALPPEMRSILLFPSDRDYLYSGRGYLSQTIYSGGKVLHLLHLAQTAQKQAQSQYDAAKMDATLGVREAFFRLVLAQNVNDATQERFRLAQDVVGRGLTGWERVEGEALVALLRSRTSETARAVEAAALSFRKQLNIELDTPVRVSGKLEAQQVDIDLNKAIVWAIELRPELQVETYKAQIDDIGVNLAQSRRIPSVVLESNYEVTGQQFPLRQNNWDATIGVKIPFSFDFGAQIKEKRAEKRQGEIKRAAAQDGVRLEVRRAYSDLQYWQSEWPQREKEFARLKTIAEAAPADARNLAPIRAQIALLDVQERYLTAVQSHILARARLERAMGRSLAR
ncbi:MAG: TolC family protein [Elusimicrobia bacterium]|nr:TolC family protein [Elusimicrobiota bacterium]